MTVRHYTGFWLKDAITTAACILTLGMSLSACKDSDTPEAEVEPAEAKNTPLPSNEISLDSVIQNLNKHLDTASEHVQGMSVPDTEEIHARTKDEVEKLFRWEYKVQDVPGNPSAESFETTLTTLGDEGWECISFQPIPDGLRVTCKRKPRGALAYLKYIPGL